MKDLIRKVWRFCTTPEMISYLVFGVLTTVVNVCVFGLCHDVWQWGWELSNLLAWDARRCVFFLSHKQALRVPQQKLCAARFPV